MMMTSAADNSSQVSLGGFGGSITLGFEHTVMDDPANPLGLDAIVFGNAFWIGNANRHWAECGYIEISRDANQNGLPDDRWYLIPGSHITDPPGQFERQTWDVDFADPTYPPANAGWLPSGSTGTWDTSGYRLPPDIFDALVVQNPNGLLAKQEGIYGYADFSPTLVLGDLDGDNVVDDSGLTPEEFYTVADDPFTVGVTPGSGGGDAFDIAWAIDAETLEPADLVGFDYVRITNGVNRIDPAVGEASPEIDAVADVAPPLRGDADVDGDVDVLDFAAFVRCVTGPGSASLPTDCVLMDFDMDGDVDLPDFGGFQTAFTGSQR